MKKNKKVHIIYVLTKLELGGAQKICLSLLKNIDSSLISGTEGVLAPEAKKQSSVYLLKSLKRRVGLTTLLFEFIAFFKMISVMRSLKKKHTNVIVHTHSTKAGLMGRWAAFFARIKKRVHTVHGFGFHEHQSKIGWLINFVLEYITSFITTHYICVSHADRNRGKELFPWFKKKSSVIRAAVEWDNFYGSKQAPLTITRDLFTFGTVSCLKPQKNIIDMLKAFKYMHARLHYEHKSRIHLQIIGDGIQRPIIESWIKKNNLEKRIDLLGWQSNVASWMQSWNAFVMSSLWEGLPCSVVEARLSKLPVISYKIAGIPEVIKNKKNGFLVKAGRWKTLGERMKTLVENNEIHKSMSNHPENLTDFQDSVMVEKHVKLYKQLG